MQHDTTFVPMAFAICLKNALRLYAKSGMLLTRGMTATRMLREASAITGTKYRRGDYARAADDLQHLMEAERAKHEALNG